MECAINAWAKCHMPFRIPFHLRPNKRKNKQREKYKATILYNIRYICEYCCVVIYYNKNDVVIFRNLVGGWLQPKFNKTLLVYTNRKPTKQQATRESQPLTADSDNRRSAQNCVLLEKEKEISRLEFDWIKGTLSTLLCWRWCNLFRIICIVRTIQLPIFAVVYIHTSSLYSTI